MPFRCLIFHSFNFRLVSLEDFVHFDLFHICVGILIHVFIKAEARNRNCHKKLTVEKFLRENELKNFKLIFFSNVQKWRIL